LDVSFEGLVSKARILGLRRHNQLRARHGSPKLFIDSQLNSIAQLYANQLAASQYFEHSFDAQNGQFGENLYKKCTYPGYPDVKNIVFRASNKWYEGSRFFNYAQPSFNTQTGHFTAMIWKSSNRVGFGIASGKKFDGLSWLNCVYVVANYLSPGNVNNADMFRANVARSRYLFN
jgi:glioma pathogenesis-related protein 2